MRRPFILLLVIFTVGCQKQEPVAQKATEPEPHPESYTNWTTKTELFAEYAPLVVGRTSRFAVHFTRLDTFKPVAKGKVEIHLTSADGKVESFSTDGPSRPGIFMSLMTRWGSSSLTASSAASAPFEDWQS